MNVKKATVLLFHTALTFFKRAYLFSSRSTPLGHTALQMPQPTQEARLMSAPL